VTNSLRGKYAIVGVGETRYGRYRPETPPSKLDLASDALIAATTDAGLRPAGVDALLSYGADSTDSVAVASALGMTLNNYVDIVGGGSSSETLVGIAIGMIESGTCDTVGIYRSLHGYSGVRIGHGAGDPALGSGLAQAYGAFSAAQQFAPVFAQYMAKSGTTSEQVAHVRAVQSRHAASNPKALYRDIVTVDDVLSSRMIVDPILHLLDCCVETDNASAIIVTSLERAKDLRQRPIAILGTAGRVSRQSPEYWFGGDATILGADRARDRIFDSADVTPDDIDVTGAYDCFTFSPTMMFEKYGFCGPGEGGDYVSSGVIALGGRRPNNTSGGQLTEGYTHGLSLVIENVRQLRWEADDSCPGGVHTYDYSPGGCRQSHEPRLSMNMGWRTPATQSAMILTRE
jgi:acetyl-CoA acetyltransferase